MNERMKVVIGTAIFLLIVLVGGSLFYNYELNSRSVTINRFSSNPPPCEMNSGLTPYSISIYNGLGRELEEITGNYSEIKTILIYQHYHYDLRSIRYLNDIWSRSFEDYLKKEDARCGLGSKIIMPLDKLDPTPTPDIPQTPVPTQTPYDYSPWRI